MPKIKILSENLVSKIAAGEVVERPASVVKELVENSLDAGAKNIKIEIEKAGLKKISVFDDGAGMNKEDLLECYKPHTTSKIASEKDLSDINSLGFRGEALASMAAVSELTIKSKPAEETLGQELSISNRQAQEILPAGMTSGTQVLVENLFSTTPARKKFLKSPATEFNQILSLVIKLALSFPLIGFTLLHNGKLVLDLPSGQTLLERARILLGQKIFQFLLPVDYSCQNITIQGFIGAPQIASRIRNRQFFFANQRIFRQAALAQAIKDAFGNLIEARAFPVFLLNLTLPNQLLDVNIHPRKEEIKFLNQPNLMKILQTAVKKTLAKDDLTYQGLENFPLYQMETLSGQDWLIHDQSADPKEKYTAHVLRKTTNLWNLKADTKENPILQIHNLYLITQTENGILIVDQHAAHERILYEQFKSSFEKNRQQNQLYHLPRAAIFDLPFNETALLINQLETFKKLGFEIELFGDSSFKVNAVPDIFKQRDIGSLIAEVLADLSQNKNLQLDLQTERTISYLACRSAIKSGDPLNEEERRRLIEKLQETKSLYTCPHGRPVKVTVSLSQLHSLFKRTGFK